MTLNPAMGAFLNMATNTKTNPNENYAREVMQLFSIGTVLLNQDGTTQNHDVTGYPLDSYDQSVVDNLKLVLTGWYIPQVSVTLNGETDDTGNYLIPMPVHLNGSARRTGTRRPPRTSSSGSCPNENGEGSPTSIPAGQPAAQDLQMAIDAIFNHPNVGPYLAKELIHSLVTSNPSPAYVERVAGFFNDNGSGQRGSLWAMAKAILLDPEARNAPADPTYGKLKEPALYMLGILRAFNAMSASGAFQSDGYINTPVLARHGPGGLPSDDGLLVLPAGLLRAAGLGRPPRARVRDHGRVDLAEARQLRQPDGVPERHPGVSATRARATRPTAPRST